MVCLCFCATADTGSDDVLYRRVHRLPWLDGQEAVPKLLKWESVGLPSLPSSALNSTQFSLAHLEAKRFSPLVASPSVNYGDWR